MSILSFLFPPRCFGCGMVGKYFCAKCSSIVRTIELNEMICPVCQKLAIDGKTHPKCQSRGTPEGLVSIFKYSVSIRKALKSIKYRYISDTAKSIIDLIPPTSHNFIEGEVIKDNSILVPIPLHKKRFRDRGFNQAEILGNYFARKFKIPVETGLLVRNRYTIPQVEMTSRKERLKNMENVFSVSHPTIQPSNHHNILLFDDVYTTGGTLLSAVKTLKQAGFANVWCVTIAR